MFNTSHNDRAQTCILPEIKFNKIKNEKNNFNNNGKKSIARDEILESLIDYCKTLQLRIKVCVCFFFYFFFTIITTIRKDMSSNHNYLFLLIR